MYIARRAFPGTARAVNSLKVHSHIVCNTFATKTEVTSESTQSEKLNVDLKEPEPVLEKIVQDEIVKRNRGAKKTDAWPNSIQQVLDTMERYPDYVVLTQIGSFYELYFEQAEKYAPIMNITLTKRTYSNKPVAFAGIPVSQIDRYLNLLVKQLGHTVAIVDQYSKESDHDNAPFRRKLTRIVTPGTYIEEAFMNLQSNNFILTLKFTHEDVKRLCVAENKVGLAWCDISTGEFFVQEVMVKDLVSAICRIKPSEILMDDALMDANLEKGEWYPELADLKKYFVKYQSLPKQMATEAYGKCFSKKPLFTEYSAKELGAMRELLEYVMKHLPDVELLFQPPKRQVVSTIMQIDSRTIDALELHQTIRTNMKKGSLLHTIRCTVTPSAARLLTQWLNAPSMDLEEIHKRQGHVEFFMENKVLADDIIQKMRNTHDIARIIQRFAYGRADVLDLVQMCKTLETVHEISKRLPRKLSHLREGLKFDQKRVKKVMAAFDEQQVDINDDVPTIDGEEKQAQKSWFIKKDATLVLKKLHVEFENMKQHQSRFQSSIDDLFVTQLGAKNVVVKLDPSLGLVLCITATQKKMIDIDEFLKTSDKYLTTKRGGKTTRWVHCDEWSSLGKDIEVLRCRIEEEERRLCRQLTKDVLAQSNEIRVVAQTLDYIDVVISFAKLAEEKHLVRPIVDDSLELKIDNGRHMVVEQSLLQRKNEAFIANSCTLDSNGTKMWVITGPNMGGKSTFLRQNAIIAILAQIGCFVPASYAKVGVVDKIFSRVGSADDLYNELSTFMVEMIETSFILKGATERSLAILDEVGRGTSGKEGCAIAYATLRHLVEKNKCRSLFATHFGESLSLMVPEGDVLFYRTDIIELDGDNFMYDRHVKRGVCVNSDAIKVAKLAGFPEDALQLASDALSN